MSELDGTLDYGQTGAVRYREEGWHSDRSFQHTPPLQSLGAPRYHLGRETRFRDDQSDSLQDDMLRRRLSRTRPEFVGAERAIEDVAIQSSDPNERDAPSRSQGSLIEFVRLERHDRQFNVLFLASGDNGQVLCAARGMPTREGWENQRDLTLTTTTFEGARPAFFDANRGSIQQIAVSQQTGKTQLWVAVRYTRSLSLLVASLEPLQAVHETEPCAVYLQVTVLDDNFSAKMQDITDVCFRGREPLELLTSHRDWCIRWWSISNHLRRKLPISKTYTVPEEFRPGSSQPLSIRSVSERLFVVTSGTFVLLYSDDGADAPIYSLETKSSVLALEICPVSPDLLVILTAKSIVWTQFREAGEGETRRLEILQSWAHHRDSFDGSLSMTFFRIPSKQLPEAYKTLQRSFSVVLYSKQNLMITEVEVRLSLGSAETGLFEVLILDPTTAFLKSRDAGQGDPCSSSMLQLKYLPVRSEGRRYAYSNNDSDSYDFIHELSFFQVFILDHSGSLSSLRCFKAPAQSAGVSPPAPSWTRRAGRYKPLSSKVATENFVVQSDDESSRRPSQNAANSAWWRVPRKRLLESEQSKSVARYNRHARILENSEHPYLPAKVTLSTVLETAIGRHEDPDQTSYTSSRLLHACMTSHGPPSDLLETNERLQSILSESAVVEGRLGASNLTEVPLQIVKPLVTNTAPSASTSLRSLYEEITSTLLAPIPKGARVGARVTFEETARYAAISAILSSILLSKPDIERDPIVAPWPSPVAPSSTTTQASQNAPTQASRLKLEVTMAPLQRHVRLRQHSDVQATVRSGSNNILGTWDGLTADMSRPPFSIDFSRHDAALKVPQSEAEQAESQRQVRKMERHQRKAEQASQTTQSSQPETLLSRVPMPAPEGPGTKRMSRPGFQSSQRPGFQSSQSHAPRSSAPPASQPNQFTAPQLSQQREPQSSPRLDLQSSQQGQHIDQSSQPWPTFHSNQLITPPSTQSQSRGMSQPPPALADGFETPQIPENSLKRSSRVVSASQSSQALPMRKKRKAGF